MRGAQLSWFVFVIRVRPNTSTISARRLCAPFDDAQGDRRVKLFEQPGQDRSMSETWSLKVADFFDWAAVDARRRPQVD